MIGLQFPFRVEKDAGKHFKERLDSLFRFDEIRAMQILEIAQYSIIYFILGFGVGSALEILFPDFDEEKPVSEVVLEVVGQLVMFVILVFYVRKMAKLVPFLFQLNWDLNGDGKIAKFKPYRTSEYAGEMTIGLVLIGSQIHFLKKIDLLSREVYSNYMGLDKRINAIF